MMIDPHAYNITVRRGDFEGELCFEARVKELPDLAEYGDTFEEAYQLAIDAIETTAEIFAEKGKAMPMPKDVPDEYSGRVTLRLPISLHRALAEAAENEGVSLNQHLVNTLAYFSGFAAAVTRTRGSSYKGEMVRTTPKRKIASTCSPIRLVHSSKLDPDGGWQKTA
ncbi:type II toxin-antitoxin system HicB family antitoxin [Thiolapillus sp.]|uniref:type II toxin-antitoxin system HicB family antitoxin n=2 Tax=Thiolapillus sp. TaxID=2017437 RepID=UPI0025FCE479|nr:toxin-antitoxin system HicB family antitoxin [Thiolapillus sp.]